ncbi:MAG: alpha/beta hydrolase, partial [Microbacterium sp.]
MTRTRTRLRSLGALITLALGATLLAAAPASADAAGFTWPSDTDTSVEGLRSTTLYVPGTTGDGTRCVVATTLTAPDDVDASHPAPAVIMGHGYSGNRGQLAAWAQFIAGQGYVTLTFDALGFGESTCQVGLDDPEYDGRVLRSLVDVLGGKPDAAFTDKDATESAGTVDVVGDDELDPLG